MLARLQSLGLPSEAIVSRLERDVLVSIARTLQAGGKSRRLARWLVRKQRCGAPVFVVRVERIMEAAGRMERPKFVKALQRAVSGSSAPVLLQRLLDSVHEVFSSSPPPLNGFF